MRFFSTLSIGLAAALVPALALAQDAGASDAGPDAAVPLIDAGPVPDASPPDQTSERCLDGYDRTHVAACAGKEPGAPCTFPGGESGQCAALRCLEEGGRALCVATRGQPAPPPDLGDAGLADPSSDVDTGLEPIGGGGCGIAAGHASSALPVSLAAFAMLCVLGRRRRGARGAL